MDHTISPRVVEKLRRIWPDADPREIAELLAECGTERVQMAVLKLADGNSERLPEFVRMAKVDWRDAVAAAEYPEEFRAGPITLSHMTPGEVRAIRQRDRKQYRKWLDR